MDPASVIGTVGAALVLIRALLKLVHEIDNISANTKNQSKLVANFANLIAKTGERLEKQQSNYNRLPHGEELPIETVESLNRLKMLLEESKKFLKELDSPVFSLKTNARRRIGELQGQIETIRLEIIEGIVHDMQFPAEERAHLGFRFRYRKRVDVNLQPRFFEGPSYLRSITLGGGGSSKRWSFRVVVPYRVSYRKK